MFLTASNKDANQIASYRIYKFIHVQYAHICLTDILYFRNWRSMMEFNLSSKVKNLNIYTTFYLEC